MRMWAKTDDKGWVNLNFVQSVRRNREGDLRLFDHEERYLGLVSRHLDFDEQLDTELVAAPSGQEALVICKYPDEAEGPRTWSRRATIVAWRVSNLGATPVIAGDSPAENERVMIIQPDGRVCDPYVALWPDVEEAEKAMLDECKAEAATKATNQES